MNISILQFPISFGNKEVNLKTMTSFFHKAMSNKPDTDIILMPELWSTGFYPGPITEYAEDMPAPTSNLLSQLAKEYQVNVVGGSLAQSHEGKIYNTASIFNRLGEPIATYDKIHLFSPAGEHKDFTPGTKLVTFQLDKVKCGIIICYDLRFPELIRSLALKGISLLFVPAAWPKLRIEHWLTLLRARAIENQLFIAAANGIYAKEEINIQPLGGSSLLIDPWGNILSQGQSGSSGEIISGHIDLSTQRDIRDKINVFKDRRPELYD